MIRLNPARPTPRIVAGMALYHRDEDGCVFRRRVHKVFADGAILLGFTHQRIRTGGRDVWLRCEDSAHLTATERWLYWMGWTTEQPITRRTTGSKEQ